MFYKPLTDAQGEVRELTVDDVKRFQPSDQALPASLKRKIGQRGLQKAPTKIPLSIRLSPHVIDAFKASGAGWQTRIDVILTNWLKTHSPDEVSI